MSKPPRIYLDNAATSWPKPDGVVDAVGEYLRDVGASAGRGAYASAQQAQRIVDQARRGCAKLLGAADSRQLVFTSNGTEALNLAIHGVLRPGDHVVSTVCEHNSVLRPLQWQIERHDVEVTWVDCSDAGYLSCDAVEQALRPNTRLVAITHASNVTGAIQPIAEVIEIAHRRGASVLVDAAQTAGCVPIDVSTWDVDLLATGGHKGLLGPLGTGLLYLRAGLETQLEPARQGGTGTESQSAQQPAEMPAKYESGNLNVPALAGLAAATEFLQQRGVAAVQSHHAQLGGQLLAGLAAIDAVRVCGPVVDEPRVAVVSFAVEGYDPQEFAAALDVAAGIECRAGLHCAPKMHERLGTLATGGLVRMSPGWSTTAAEIDAALEAVAALAQATIGERR